MSANEEPTNIAPPPVRVRFFTCAQVARMLQISVRGVQDLCGAKKLKGTRIGKLWRIDPDDLEAYIARLKAGEA